MFENTNAKKFTVKKQATIKDDNYITTSIRLHKRINEQFNELAQATNITKNKLMESALAFALENVEVINDGE